MANDALIENTLAVEAFTDILLRSGWTPGPRAKRYPSLLAADVKNGLAAYFASLDGQGLEGVAGSTDRVQPETELAEARQLNRRYRDALRLIQERPDPWCSDYAMCDHEVCRASHRAFEIARKALDVESSF